MDIVYRIGDGHYGPGSVVFAEHGRAAYVAHLYKALEESKTWGELRGNLPDGEWEDRFLVCFEDREEEIPADDDLFGSGLNGEFLELPADKAEPIADDLRAMGHTVGPTDLEFA